MKVLRHSLFSLSLFQIDQTQETKRDMAVVPVRIASKTFSMSLVRQAVPK